VSDALRIDLALARAAGLPSRSANDASAPRETGVPTPAPGPDAMFSPLAVLLTRFLSPPGTPAPTPTPEEAQLLLAYLQQRVVAVLQAAGVAVLPTLRVSVDSDGGLRLKPAPARDERVASLLRQDPDVMRLANVLRRPLPAIGTSGAVPHPDTAIAEHAPAPLRSEPGPRRVWPWFGAASSSPAAQRASRIMTPLVEAAFGLGAIAALLLAAWVLS
jgi:hypothetical protein